MTQATTMKQSTKTILRKITSPMMPMVTQHQHKYNEQGKEVNKKSI